MFGNAGADVQVSRNVARAFSGYNYNNFLDPRQDFMIPDVYDEITDFVAKRNPTEMEAGSSGPFLIVM